MHTLRVLLLHRTLWAACPSATYTLRSTIIRYHLTPDGRDYKKTSKMNDRVGDQRIPLWLIKQAKGIAFITEIRTSFMLAAKGGTGIVIAKGNTRSHTHRRICLYVLHFVMVGSAEAIISFLPAFASLLQGRMASGLDHRPLPRVGWVLTICMHGIQLLGRTIMKSHQTIVELGEHRECPHIFVGFGFTFGGSKTDNLLLLNADFAVKAFASAKQLKLGGDLQLAVGPLGMSATHIQCSLAEGHHSVCVLCSCLGRMNLHLRPRLHHMQSKSSCEITCRPGHQRHVALR